MVVHLFPGQGDFTLSPLLPEIWSNQLLRDQVGSIFELIDPVGAEFGLRAIGPRLLGTDETGSDGTSTVSTGALAAENPGTLQLALFGTCLAVHRTLVAAGFPARRILAVSFGEIPALAAAGACSAEDGARLACRLGQLLVRRQSPDAHTPRPRALTYPEPSVHASLRRQRYQISKFSSRALLDARLPE